MLVTLVVFQPVMLAGMTLPHVRHQFILPPAVTAACGGSTDAVAVSAASSTTSASATVVLPMSGSVVGIKMFAAAAATVQRKRFMVVMDVDVNSTSLFLSGGLWWRGRKDGQSAHKVKSENQTLSVFTLSLTTNERCNLASHPSIDTQLHGDCVLSAWNLHASASHAACAPPMCSYR